jgi:predicted GH43/DUF377 family glycosyl hydrolase
MLKAGRVLAAFAGILATADSQVAIHAERVAQEPLLRPGLPWASTGVFNPTAIRRGRKTVLLFRATDSRKVSSIGYAESADGVHFTMSPQPVLAPEADYEKGGGVEDPRVVKIGGTYYLTYTGYNLHDAQLCLATSTDLKNWSRQGVILPAYRGRWNTAWTKSGAIVPRKINGKWWMFYMGTSNGPDGQKRDKMGLAMSDDLLHWSDATDQPVLEVRPHAFDSRVMEPGPAPTVTSSGILLLYNGADDKLVYRPAWVLFDVRDPRRVLARAEEPFMAPELEWERIGVVPNVIFLEGAVVARRGEITGYYGASDKYVGAMRIHIVITQTLLHGRGSEAPH